MPRKAATKRPPVEYKLVVSDHTRKPVPTVPANATNLARYTITPLGHVFRCDGRLVLPFKNSKVAHRCQLKVSFNDNRYTRSLPKLVFLAFGHPRLIERWRDRSDLHSYVPWIDPEGPLDPLTNRTRCTVHDVVLVPMGELSYRVRENRPLKTRLSILTLP